MLLRRDDINPNKPDEQGNTTLGQDDVNTDTSDVNGQTPLYYAALYVRDGVVKMLLGRKDVNPDKLDKHGRTPLSFAARNGYSWMIALLQPPTAGPTPRTKPKAMPALPPSNTEPATYPQLS